MVNVAEVQSGTATEAEAENLPAAAPSLPVLSAAQDPEQAVELQPRMSTSSQNM